MNTGSASFIKKISPGKASGPENIPNWFLKAYAEVLAQPVCKILKSSYAEQQLPKSWKLVNTVLLINTKSVSDICKLSDLFHLPLLLCCSVHRFSDLEHI